MQLRIFVFRCGILKPFQLKGLNPSQFNLAGVLRYLRLTNAGLLAWRPVKTCMALAIVRASSVHTVSICAWVRSTFIYIYKTHIKHDIALKYFINLEM